MTQNASEPRDPPSDEDLPGGWTGGELRHSGGGIYVREFYDEGRQIRVIYNRSDPGVGVQRVRWNEGGEYWEFDQDADDPSPVNVETGSVEENFETALQLIRDIEAGEYDL